MRTSNTCSFLLLVLSLFFCRVVAAAMPEVRFSEIHYDNAGTDTGEAIEVSGPAGTDLTGWSIVLYNGTGGAVYNTSALSGSIPATCGSRGVVVISYASNGIQNGSPDGMALVDATGHVIEFLSYGGTFIAVGGPADGLLSADIGVSESSPPIGQSLQRDSSDNWQLTTSTFGACNDDGSLPPPDVASASVAPATASVSVGMTQAFTATAFDNSDQPVSGVSFVWTSNAPSVATVDANGVAQGVAEGDAVITATAPNGIAGTAALHVAVALPISLPEIRFSEIHYDNTGTDTGEAIEVSGPAGTDLSGWRIVLYNGAPYSSTTLSGSIPATCGSRGVVVLSYPTNGIQNGSPDGMALVDGSGVLVEFLSYEGTFAAIGGLANGVLSTDIIAFEESTSPIGQSLQRDSFNHWQLVTSTFGACNDAPPVVDSTPPIITPAVTGTLGTNGWFRGDVSVTWTVTDDESAITAETGCDAASVTADTAGTTFTCSATSQGGTSTQSVTVSRDTTPPIVTIVAPPNGATYPAGGSVSSSYTCADGLSGISSCNGPVPSGSPVDTLSAGSKVFTVTATDAAGNVASARTAYTVIDATPPLIVPVVTGTLGDNGWYRSDVIVNWQVSDPESSISAKSGCDTSVVTSNTSSASFTCSATSAGGTSSQSVTIRRDVDPPLIGILIPFNGLTVKRNQLVIALYACVDLRSGVAQCTGTTPVLSRVDTATTGLKSFTVNARDNAGNSQSSTVQYTVR